MYKLSNIFQVIAIVGPTASGKSALADALALDFKTKVISADAMQVYRFMDIGTAKTPLAERKVELLGIDLVNPDEQFSASNYQMLVRPEVDKLNEEGLPAILCGGSGLYVDALIDDMHFPQGEQLENLIREKYERYASEHGAQALHALLSEKDPKSAKLIHPHNSRRVIRALEMLEDGISYAEQSEKLHEHKAYYSSIIFGLNMQRDILYERINQRVDTMFDMGLVEEVRMLLDQGFLQAATAKQAIGYKEIVQAFAGEISLDEARDKIKQASRRYAKRQLTWFRRDPRIIWLDSLEQSLKEQIECIKVKIQKECDYRS
ncbi:MAG: tRNA (adenosine(37)-N6)-dimethylallyltransferase MiaA [Coriobacteriia bacterium]|nr:tRNA (adenosine(37)-N6)-dimethylallyltransferase MiaA [Coriobacteriia bacterium]